MHLHRPSLLGAIAACVASAGLAGVAVAQPAEEPVPGAAAERAGDAGEDDGEYRSDPPPGIEVLRVRGRGLGQIETELPSSVTSFDAATIEALGAQDISDLSRVTPNVSIVQPGATQATFFVRGIGLSDFSSNAAGAVTIFQDDVAINAPAIQTGQLFDLEGVEVVRGPQGTGHFRNASAGAIRVRSRRPSGNYAAQLRASLGRYAADGGKGAHHGQIQEYEGHLEVPLVDDLLSTRFAFRAREAEPYLTNGCGGAPPFDQRPDVRDAARATRSRNQTVLNEFIATCGEIGNTYRERFDPGRNSSTISTIPPGMPDRVGDQDNWASRGTLRLTPPQSEWDLLANLHGSRLDQQQTFGQAIGTGTLEGGTNTGQFGGFGGRVQPAGESLYWEPDLREEYIGLDGTGGLCRSPNAASCSNRNAQAELARNLSRKRPLDIRPFRGDYDRVGQVSRDSWGGFLSAEGEIGDYEIFVLASYDGYERRQVQDLDFTPEELIFQDADDEAWQTYEEIRIEGELDATPFAWEVGAYYLFEDLDTEIDNRILDGLFRTGSDSTFDIRRDFDQQIHSLAVWGGFSWDFLEDLTLSGGVRWNHERKDFSFEVDGIIGGAKATSQDETWSEPTGEIILTWHFDERAQLYARYTRGFKAGHFNSLATARLDTLLAERETNDAWETGLRGAFFEGRVRLGGAFFYYRYTDFQVFLFSDSPQQSPTLEIVNADDAELYGLELEGSLRPLDGLVPRFLEALELSGNFSWLQGQYLDFQDEETFALGGGFTTVTFDFSGNDLANAPKYKVSGTAEWTLDLGRYGYLVPRYDVSWTDDQFFDPREGRGSVKITGEGSLPELTIAQQALLLHNVRLAYRTPTGNVEIAGWVRNLSDEVYKTFAFDATRFGGVVINFVGEPRTIGLDVVVTF